MTTRSPRLPSPRILFTPADLTPGRTLLFRLALVLALLGLVILILWLDRAGLRDQFDGDLSFNDIVYFTMVTVTTVGYGDIVPVTPRARLIDALVVTPIRVVVWFLFLGTAYQLVIRRYMEAYRMAKLHARLDKHVVVCGFGHTGLSTVTWWSGPSGRRRSESALRISSPMFCFASTEATRCSPCGICRTGKRSDRATFWSSFSRLDLLKIPASPGVRLSRPGRSTRASTKTVAPVCPIALACVRFQVDGRRIRGETDRRLSVFRRQCPRPPVVSAPAELLGF